LPEAFQVCGYFAPDGVSGLKRLFASLVDIADFHPASPHIYADTHYQSDALG
jgi:hypothetical protein